MVSNLRACKIISKCTWLDSRIEGDNSNPNNSNKINHDDHKDGIGSYIEVYSEKCNSSSSMDLKIII